MLKNESMKALNVRLGGNEDWQSHCCNAIFNFFFGPTDQ